MVCGFCSVGCSLDVNVTDGVAVSLTPTKDYPVNLGMACPKGWEALTGEGYVGCGIPRSLWDKFGGIAMAGSSGKVALVTGASTGLGHHFAQVLAKHGAAVAVTGGGAGGDGRDGTDARRSRLA